MDHVKATAVNAVNIILVSRCP